MHAPPRIGPDDCNGRGCSDPEPQGFSAAAAVRNDALPPGGTPAHALLAPMPRAAALQSLVGRLAGLRLCGDPRLC
jgi:hypothetical protein